MWQVRDTRQQIAWGRVLMAEGLKSGRRELARRVAPLRTVILHSSSARSQSERAYLLIRDLIVTLHLKPGSVIEEGRLQQELHLGRTPIREALQRLAHENLVSVIPHRGTFVTDINITDLARLTEVRIDLEGCAARLAAERATEDERSVMRDLVRELRSLNEAQTDDLIQLDQRIHRIIYQASRNQFLEDVCDRYFNLSVRLWFLFLPRVPLREAVIEQLELLEAVIARDPHRAESVLRRHIAGFEEEVRRIL